jgi:DNA-binding CsgD family transcriptional regulator/tetratricopeptide (TPR) repeat protein
MPVMGIRAMSPVLIGRQAEMARLLEALAVAADGGSSVALVSGEAGVGKTRLVHEFGGRARERGFRVCVGRGLDFGGEVWPLAPLREIVAALAEELDAETLDLVIGGARDALIRLVPEVGAGEDGRARVSRDRLGELVIGVFDRLARRDPLVLVVEDLHWADATTRMLFSALARTRRVRPLLLIGTLRSDELHRRHPLRPMLAEVERGSCERIELRPLNRAATRELCHAIEGSAADAAFVDAVHDRSGGNPFFIEELVAARTAGVAGLPETLRDVMLARAAALDDAALSVLDVSAAAGPTTPEVLADVSGVEADDFPTTLDALFAAALLVPDGDQVRFRHELGREVFYDELLPGDRVRLHATLADRLSVRRPDRIGDIARHWAAANDSPRALVASVAAGRELVGAGAAAEAEQHLVRALELWESVDGPATLVGRDHAGLLLEAATAAEHARDLGRAIEFARRAAVELAGVDPMREAEVWLELRDLYRFTNRWDESADAVDHALDLIPELPPSGLRARALANAAIEATYVKRLDEATARAREAVAVAEAVGDPEVLVFAHYSLGAAFGLTDPERELASSLANLARCGPGVSPELTVTVYSGIAVALADLARYAEVLTYAERGIAFSRRGGLGGHRTSWLAAWCIESLVALGRWSDAEQRVAELADLLEGPNEEGCLAPSWGMALTRQGRLDEARPVIDYARAAIAGGVWAYTTARMVGAIAEFDAADGRGEDAVALVDEHVDQEPRHPDGDAWLVAAGMAALADYVHLGEGRARRAVAERADAMATRWLGLIESNERRGWRPGPEQQLHRDHAHAQRERLRGRSDPYRWSKLAAGWAELGFRYHEALARLRGADALLGGLAGRAASARRPAAAELGAARTIAVELGAVPLLDEIDDLARRARLGRDPGAPAEQPSGDGDIVDDLGLSARERDVLALLARGYTNGQIGQELYISTKTASVHVSNILRKLGVTNRVEAAAAYARRPSLR